MGSTLLALSLSKYSNKRLILYYLAPVFLNHQMYPYLKSASFLRHAPTARLYPELQSGMERYSL
jgi:hypothetical protein